MTKENEKEHAVLTAIEESGVNMAKNCNDIECPECGKVMEEIWQSFCDADDNEAEGMVGYECENCDIRYDLNGEER